MKIINTLILIALCLSCDDQALENNQVPTIVIDVDNDSRQFVDSGNDAGMVQDMTNDVTIPAPTIFPLAPENIKKATEENDGKEFYTALLPTTDNTEKLIVPHYNDVFSESRVVSKRLADESFETLSIQGTLVGSLSVVEFNEKTYLYYGSSDNLDAAFTTYRMEWDGDAFLDAEVVYEFGSLLNWPRFVVRDDEVWVVSR